MAVTDSYTLFATSARGSRVNCHPVAPGRNPSCPHSCPLQQPRETSMRSLAAFSTLALAVASTMSLAQTGAPAPLPANPAADPAAFKTDTRTLRDDVRAYMQNQRARMRNQRAQDASDYSQLRADPVAGHAAAAAIDTTKPQTDRSPLQPAQMPTRKDAMQAPDGVGPAGRHNGHRR